MGFATRLYNNERLHQALGYRAPRRAFDDAVRIAKRRRETNGWCLVPIVS
jgi:hypothetical protein